MPATAKLSGNSWLTFKEFPPRQKAASFSIDQVMEKLTEPAHKYVIGREDLRERWSK